MKKNKYIQCIFGINNGKKYLLKEGINRVGRGFLMDICLDDMQVTRDNHCIFIYEAKTGKVIIVPTVDSLTYLNNQKLVTQQYVGIGDLIRIGRSELIISE